MQAIIKLIVDLIFLALEIVIGIGAAIIEAIMNWLGG